MAVLFCGLTAKGGGLYDQRITDAIAVLVAAMHVFA